MRLTSDRLILREFALRDEADVHRYASDPEVVRYVDWGPNTPDETAARVKTNVEAQHQDESDLSWAITRHDDDRVIGSAAVWVESSEHSRAQFGYVLARHVWGEGYATEVARALRRYAFGHLRMHRLVATCHPDNAASIRVLEKTGLTCEGRLRDHLRVRGAWRDSMVFAAINDG